MSKHMLPASSVCNRYLIKYTKNVHKRYYDAHDISENVNIMLLNCPDLAKRV